ncbi:MAG TPA: hypothetical protein PL082_06570 [Tepidiformaceae bacterium]|nr:hypothetical protein [Tepidiformaceae bacterium]
MNVMRSAFPRLKRAASRLVPHRRHWRPYAEINANVRTIERLLRSFGIGRGRAQEIAGELRADLQEAAATGNAPETVLGPDLRGFAARLAEAHGRAPVPSRVWLIVLTMGLPMAAVALGTYIAIGGGENLGLDYYSISLTTHESVPSGDGSGSIREVSYGDAWLPLAVYSLAAFVGVAGAFGLTAWMLRVIGDVRLGATLRRLAVVLPVTGVAGVGAAMLVGAASDYRTTQRVILAEGLVAGSWLVLGIAFAREWARRVVPSPWQGD